MKKFEWVWSHTEPAIVIEYQYTPADPGVAYYADGSGQPPSPAYIDVVGFTFRGADITNLMEMFMDESMVDDIEDEIIEWEQNADRHFLD